MSKFFALYISRSDGKSEIKGHNRLIERNEPTKEQLDRTPDAKGLSDYYREVAITEQKHMDWRRKIGGMLARDLGLPDSDRGYILAAFPENYRLYEHVKRAEDESKAKTTKNHAGGGNERQDAYLYGHPLGRKKRFRSPADFYPHVYWLATDEEGDQDNCACKICCPEELDEKTLPRAVKDVQQPSKVEVKIDIKPEAPARKLVAVQIPGDNVSKPQSAPQSTALGQAGGKIEGTFLGEAPTYLVTNEDQRLDLEPASFLYRQGELVWFKRGSAWGLGVLGQRQRHVSMTSYTVQPLSYPYRHPSHHNMSTDDLRPWLSWSAPSLTHVGLQGRAITYETADWQAISSGHYGPGSLEVDASILAAKAIANSYTPFEALSTQTLPPTTTKTQYNGVFLGAERIWRGDIVRLNDNNNLEVQLVTAIVERTTAPPGRPTITLHGPIFTLRQLLNPTSLPDLSALPPRLAADLDTRNRSTLSKHGYACIYAPGPVSSVDASQVKGRWYEAAVLGPVLLGAEQARQELAAGNLGEMGPRLNSRMDGKMDIGVRRPDRRAAIGAAVPQGFRVGGEDAVGEFMNLDG